MERGVEKKGRDVLRNLNIFEARSSLYVLCEVTTTEVIGLTSSSW